MTIPAELLLVAQHLGELTERVVFVGGMVRGILVTDLAVAGPRPTRDVDLITELPSFVEYHAMNESLRRLGFRESMEDEAPICRWNIEGVPVDVMPIDPAILGFSNVWYRGGFDNSTRVESDSLRLRIIDAPHFCATKLESFFSRGGQDFYHHDLEDVVVLVDGRPELVDEVRVAPADLQRFLADEISTLLANDRFMEALPGHLGPDAASQARLPLIISRLQSIAAVIAVKGAIPTSPTHPSGRTPQPSLRELDVAQLQSRQLPDRLAGGWQPLRSTSIRAAAYDATTGTLTVQFTNRAIYEYLHVPATIWAGWQRTASAGRYHQQWIRKKYRYRRVR